MSVGRTRSIKPTFPGDEALGRCSRDARLLFVCLWATCCDDYGRFRATPAVLRGAVFPFDDDLKNSDLEVMLEELEREGRILRWREREEPWGRVLEWKSLWQGCRVRKAIPVAVRRQVLERDGFRCRRCDATTDLTLDHVVPYSCDGEDSVENLRVLCRSCNSSRGPGRW